MDQPTLPSKDHFEDVCSVIEDACEEQMARVSFLEPRSFFVAWNGVLCLVFRGFPTALVQLKQQIKSSASNLKPENFGSKWPKITLGFVRNHDEDVTMQSLERIQQVCQSFEQRLANANWMRVSKASVVHYKSRSLETLYDRHDVMFRLTNPTDEAKGRDDESAVSEEERGRVDSVLAEWDSLEEYLKRVKEPLTVPYRHETLEGGYTCVVFLSDDSDHTELRNAIDSFKQAIDEALPGVYEWLDTSSLHCTIRTMDPAH